MAVMFSSLLMSVHSNTYTHQGSGSQTSHGRNVQFFAHVSTFHHIHTRAAVLKHHMAVMFSSLLMSVHSNTYTHQGSGSQTSHGRNVQFFAHVSTFHHIHTRAAVLKHHMAVMFSSLLMSVHSNTYTHQGSGSQTSHGRNVQFFAHVSTFHHIHTPGQWFSNITWP
ncbi:hypothetical protein BgiBS90_016831 [Biomphalaria glabrata]|nr:hypothetical protein BgiBS90_016831 [Biomphalaria glabrata]